jgi:D-alanine-D-alanine ligase
LVLALTLHKGLTKQVIRDLHLPTPEFALVETEAEIAKISLPFPLFAKPVAEGTGKGITATSKIHSSTELYDVCHNLLLTYTQPVLVETFLPGREFTVGIVGTGGQARTLGTLEVLLHDDAEHDVYSYVNKEYCEELVEYRLVNDTLAKQAEEVALAAWKGLGCRDAGRIDLRTDRNGIPHFIEVNPLAGLHPEHSDLPILCSLIEMSYHELIDIIMRSALQRAHTSETPSSLKQAA